MDNTPGSGQPLQIPIKFKPILSPYGQSVGFEPNYALWWHYAGFSAPSDPNGFEPWIYLRFNKGDLHDIVDEMVADTDQLYLHFDWYALLKEFCGYGHFFAFESIKIEVYDMGVFYHQQSGGCDIFFAGNH